MLMVAALCLSAPLLHAYSPLTEPTPRDTAYFQATTGYRFQSFSDADRRPWHTYSAELGYDYGPGSVSIAYDRASRFGAWDDIITMDAYPALGGDRYAHVRIRHAFSPTVFPAREYQVELFHLFGEKWLPFVSTQMRRYSSLDVYFLGAGLDIYYSSWFARGTFQALWLDDSRGGFLSALVRRYIQGTGTYLEAHAGYGREPVVIAQGPVISGVGSSYSAGLGGQYFPNARAGFSIMSTAIKSAALPLRFGLLVALMYRW